MAYQNATNIKITGLVAADGNGVFNGRALTGGSGITVTNGDGVAGAPDIALTVPVTEILGGTNQATYTTGDVLYASGANTLSKLAVGFNTEVLTLAAGVPSWAAPTTGTVTSVSGTASRITSSGGATPVIDIDAAYVGQASITTLGTIATGVWEGTTVAVNQGGSGQTSYTNGQLLIGNTTGNTLDKATITGGTGVTVTNGAGTITIDADNNGTVTSVSGTANRISSTGGATPVIDIDAAYVGQASITTLGTVTTGTWNATDIAVADGGTGRSSSTAYGVLCGGTTSTAAQQSIASVGTSGQVLTSNGAAALPTFQAAAGGGIIVQQVRASSTARTSTSSIIPQDGTTPQNTEGAEYITASITPTNSSNILCIDFSSFVGSGSGILGITVALFQDSTADALNCSATTCASGSYLQPNPLRHFMTAGTTSSTTFKIRFGTGTANTGYMLRRNSDIFGGAATANLSITEIEV